MTVDEVYESNVARLSFFGSYTWSDENITGYNYYVLDRCLRDWKSCISFWWPEGTETKRLKLCLDHFMQNQKHQEFQEIYLKNSACWVGVKGSHCSCPRKI